MEGISPGARSGSGHAAAAATAGRLGRRAVEPLRAATLPRGRPGAGAAGGLGAGLMFFTPARLRPGVEIILEAVRFEEVVQGADFVITGEGRTDFQTAFGKAPVGIAKVAKKFGVPVFCLSGGLGEGADNVLAHGIDAVLSVCDRPMTLDDCMNAGEELIESGSIRLCRIVKAVKNRS